MTTDIDLLYAVADSIHTGWELCDSRWQKSEAEHIACQAITSCALNHRKHGDAFSWQGTGTKSVSGGGLANNPAGMRLLLDDDCIVLEPYDGPLTPPEDIVHDDRGRPMVIRVTNRLLHYAAGTITPAATVPTETKEAG